jgi:hypothetical protein
MEQRWDAKDTHRPHEQEFSYSAAVGRQIEVNYIGRAKNAQYNNFDEASKKEEWCKNEPSLPVGVEHADGDSWMMPSDFVC